jgi:hypothetical protein
LHDGELDTQDLLLINSVMIMMRMKDVILLKRLIVSTRLLLMVIIQRINIYKSLWNIDPYDSSLGSVVSVG